MAPAGGRVPSALGTAGSGPPCRLGHGQPEAALAMPPNLLQPVSGSGQTFGSPILVLPSDNTGSGPEGPWPGRGDLRPRSNSRNLQWLAQSGLETRTLRPLPASHPGRRSNRALSHSRWLRSPIAIAAISPWSGFSAASRGGDAALRSRPGWPGGWCRRLPVRRRTPGAPRGRERSGSWWRPRRGDR